MIERRFRLLSSRQFRYTFEKGKKLSSSSGSLFWVLCPNTEKVSAKVKVGLVVSKKHGHAVNRNKFKRWLRVIFYHELIKPLKSSKLEIKYPICVVFVLYKTPTSFRDFESEIKNLLTSFKKQIAA